MEGHDVCSGTNRNLSLAVVSLDSSSAISLPSSEGRRSSIEGDKRIKGSAIVLGNLTKCRMGFGDRGIAMRGYRNERRDSEGRGGDPSYKIC